MIDFNFARIIYCRIPKLYTIVHEHARAYMSIYYRIFDFNSTFKPRILPS